MPHGLKMLRVSAWFDFVYVAFIIDAFCAGLSACVSGARRIQGLCSMLGSSLCMKGGDLGPIGPVQQRMRQTANLSRNR
jgi:hypothetical protein